jgi:hypothetical protein
MQGESGGGWSAGKIILAIAGGCFLLTTLCCTGTYFAKQDEINEAFSFMGETYSFGVQFAEGVGRFEAGFAEEFGEDGRWRIDSAGEDRMVLAIGLEGGAGEADIEALQDKAWALWVESFPQGGMPIVAVGIGSAGELALGEGGAHQGTVHDWLGNTADVEALVERTGIAAPPPSELFEHMEELSESQRGGNGVTIKTDDGKVKVEIKAGSDE